MTDDSAPTSVRALDSAGVPESDGALVSRLRLIEEQSLDSRAQAYVRLHDELRTRLEGADAAIHE